MTTKQIEVERIDDQVSRVKIILEFAIVRDNEDELREDIDILVSKFDFIADDDELDPESEMHRRMARAEALDDVKPEDIPL